MRGKQVAVGRGHIHDDRASDVTRLHRVFHRVGRAGDRLAVQPVAVAELPLVAEAGDVSCPLAAVGGQDVPADGMAAGDEVGVFVGDRRQRGVRRRRVDDETGCGHIPSCLTLKVRRGDRDEQDCAEIARLHRVGRSGCAGDRSAKHVHRHQPLPELTNIVARLVRAVQPLVAVARVARPLAGVGGQRLADPGVAADRRRRKRVVVRATVIGRVDGGAPGRATAEVLADDHRGAAVAVARLSAVDIEEAAQHALAPRDDGRGGLIVQDAVGVGGGAVTRPPLERVGERVLLEVV